tara:strand:- start:5227 stop:5724 length:498 start_codon:yes stop_codon:yes gene_type:complete
MTDFNSPDNNTINEQTEQLTKCVPESSEFSVLPKEIEGEITVEQLFSNIALDDIPLMDKPKLERVIDETLPEGAENVTAWVEHGETDVMQMFSCLNAFKEGTDKVEWDMVDYEVYGEDWYRQKYPNFPDEWYELLVKASREKFKDLSRDDSTFTKTDGNFTVKWD